MKYFLKPVNFIFLFLLTGIIVFYALPVLCYAQNPYGEPEAFQGVVLESLYVHEFMAVSLRHEGEVCEKDYECITENCFNGACRKKGYCETDDECSFSEYCSSDNSCMGLKPISLSCSRNSECKTENCFKGVCKEKEYCEIDNDCPSNQYCSENKCKLKAVGLPCFKDAECETKNCFKGVCKEGGYCEIDNDCSFDQYCYINKCRTKKSCGLSCDINEECETKNCFKGTCRDQEYCEKESDCSSVKYCYFNLCSPLKPLKSECIENAECETKNCFNRVCTEKGNTGIYLLLIPLTAVFLLIAGFFYMMTRKKPPANQINEGLPAKTIKKRYNVIKKIGKTGGVFAAEDTSTKLYVLLKEASLEASDDRISLKKLQDEAQNLKKCNHSNIARYIDSFTEDGNFYLVSEFVNGYTLEYKFENFPLNDSAAKEIMIKILDAMEYLNSMKIHVNLTPEDIIADEKNNPVIITLPGKPEGTKAQTEKYLTAPETGQKAVVDVLSGIFSAGVIMVFILSGAKPVKWTDPESFLKGIGIESNLTRIIAKATETEPGKRYQSAREMKEALMKVL